MTDDEILFDFFSVEERNRVVKEMQVTPYDDEERSRPAESFDLLPETGTPTRETRTAVTADRDEFIRWFEEEVGPWQMHQA